MRDINRRGNSGAGAAVMADQPVMLIRYRRGGTERNARTVHRVPMPDGREAGAVGTLCGALLDLDDTDIVTPNDDGVTCPECAVSRASAIIGAGELSSVSSDGEDAGLVGGATYRTWGWPVTQHRGQTQLRLHRDVSAIAIPVPLVTDVTRILTARYCAPAVLAHPDDPGHGIVLMGERFPSLLPWPLGVHQIIGVLVLPPAMTPRGQVSWIQHPHKDSLQLSREIDVFGALRTALSG